MTRAALVIKTYGDPEIAGAIVDGMTKRCIPLNNDELTALRAELARLRARTDVRKYREDRDWHLVQLQLQHKYRIKQHSVLYNRLLLGWTLAWLVGVECARRVSLWFSLRFRRMRRW